jgi:hypothetical protein
VSIRLQDQLLSSGATISPDTLGAMVVKNAPGLAYWDTHCLFRNTHFDGAFLPSVEAAVGIASLAISDEAEASTDGDNNKNKGEDTASNDYHRRSASKIDLAWRSVMMDESMTFDQFSDLLDRMLRTGHFLPRSLVRLTRFFPPEWYANVKD